MTTDLTNVNEAEKVLALAADDEAKGFEHVTSDSTKLAMITILQVGSPVCKDRNRDASIIPGNLFNSITCMGKEKVTVIPVLYKQRWLEWIPREQGGGLVNIHRDFPKDAIRQKFGKSMSAQGYDLVDTRLHYVLYLNDEGFYNPAIISMCSTGVPKSQLWVSQMQQNRKRVINDDGTVSEKTLAMYSKHYEVFTALQRDKKTGQEWYNWEVRPLNDKPVQLFAYQLARSMYEILMKAEESETKEAFSVNEQNINTEY